MSVDQGEKVGCYPPFGSCPEDCPGFVDTTLEVVERDGKQVGFWISVCPNPVYRGAEQTNIDYSEPEAAKEIIVYKGSALSPAEVVGVIADFKAEDGL